MESYSRIRSVKMKRSNADEPFGFSVRGGHEHGTGLFVSSIEPRSLAHKARLKVGDQILRLNGFPVSAAIHSECLALMRYRTSIHLKVRSVGMVPVREKIGDPLTWKLVEEPPLPPLEETLSMTKSQHHHGRMMNGGPRQPSHPQQQHHHSRHSGSDSSSHFESRLDSHGSETKVFIDTNGHSGLGCCICKGPPERPGIFVQSTKSNGVAREAGLRPGDQILQCNGHSFLNIAFHSAVFHLKISKHLNLIVVKGAASDLFPGESSGYNSSASSLNGDTHISSISSHSNPIEINGEIDMLDHHHQHRRLPLVSEERHQRISSKGSSGSECAEGIVLDRHIEWNEVEESWKEAEKERLVIQVRGSDEISSKHHHPPPPSDSSRTTSVLSSVRALENAEEKRLLDERRKLLEDQRRLIEEAVKFEEEKRQFEEEKRQLALLKELKNSHQPPVAPPADQSGTLDPRMSSSSSDTTSTTNTSNTNNHVQSIQNGLAGALHKEILKRVERRENSVTSDKGEDERPKPGTVDQKISLFANTADIEKRQQHEQLIKEFKRAHRKMFAHSLEQLDTASDEKGEKPERKFIGAKRIQKEVEHERKMVQQQVAGIVRQRQLRIERQHQESQETEREVGQAKSAPFKQPSTKSGPPPPPPVNQVEVKSSPAGSSNSKWTTVSIKLPDTSGGGGGGGLLTTAENLNGQSTKSLANLETTKVNSAAASAAVEPGYVKKKNSSAVNIQTDEIEIPPESPSPDYSNSPSPTPGSGGGDQWEEHVSANGNIYSRSGNTKFGFPPNGHKNSPRTPHPKENQDLHPNGHTQKIHGHTNNNNHHNHHHSTNLNQKNNAIVQGKDAEKITTSGNGKVTIILGDPPPNQMYNTNNNNSNNNFSSSRNTTSNSKSTTKSTGGILKMANGHHSLTDSFGGQAVGNPKTISFGEF